MDFEIEPYRGVGPIHLGMTVDEVRTRLGGDVRTLTNKPYAPGDTDAFIDRGILVHYSASGRCEAIEFGASTPTFDGHPLLERPFREVYELLKSYDPALQVHDTGLTSTLLGIGIYMPSLSAQEQEDWEKRTEGVIVFKRGYYSGA